MKTYSRFVLFFLIALQILLFQNCAGSSSGSSDSASVHIEGVAVDQILNLQAIKGKKYYLIEAHDANDASQSLEPYIYEFSSELGSNEIIKPIGGPMFEISEPPMDCNGRLKQCAQKDNGEFHCQTFSTSLSCYFHFDVSNYYFIPARFAALRTSNPHEIKILDLTTRSYVLLREILEGEISPTINEPALVSDGGSN